MHKHCRNCKYVFALLAAIGTLAACCNASAQSFSVIHAFGNGTDGVRPRSSLLRDKAGNMYGTTYAGGLYDAGTVYEISSSGTETVLYSMGIKSIYDGDEPEAPLIQDAEGNLYGTNSAGGRYDDGTVFKLTPDGSYHILHTFTWGKNGNLKDGAQPYAPLLSAGGFLYGITGSGGPDGSGTAFRLMSDGTRYRIVYTFGRTDGGGLPIAGLTKDAGKVFFGTTEAGGAYGWGTVFQLKSDGTETTLHSFSSGTDGGSPFAGLIMDSQGNLYGATSSGGAENYNSCGVVFKMTQGGAETVLYSFECGSDGGKPWSNLIADKAGNLYGTTTEGGETNSTCTLGCGVVFRVRPDKTEEVLHTFTGGSDGYRPEGTLIWGPNHTLMGTATSGGAYNGGTAFSVTP